MHFFLLSDWVERTELNVIRRDVQIFDVDRVASIIRVDGARKDDLSRPVSGNILWNLFCNPDVTLYARAGKILFRSHYCIGCFGTVA